MEMAHEPCARIESHLPLPGIRSLDLKHLRHFVGIIDAGSLSKAAQRLHVAQPALSNRLAALELTKSVIESLIRSGQWKHSGYLG